jgi:hypothetical protein
MSLLYAIAFIVLLMLVAYASLMNKKKAAHRKPADPTLHGKADKPA